MAVLTCGILWFSSFRATLSNVAFCISPEKEDSGAGDTVDDGKRKRGQLASAHSDTLHLFRRGFQRTVRVFFSPSVVDRPHVLFLSFPSDRKIGHRFVPILVLFPCCCSPYQ